MALTQGAGPGFGRGADTLVSNAQAKERGRITRKRKTVYTASWRIGKRTIVMVTKANRRSLQFWKGALSGRTLPVNKNYSTSVLKLDKGKEITKSFI